ncbi:hypothetical protein JHK82_046421 [Glycine max]|uniref:Uncharacterized protein n=2 Tax=Glycine subgen. Soja TaxID=1462606 RepID=A0A0R0FHV0_SOYBN|nr:hypothetical protein JHK86_046319 [Glycine max]RZB54907.1 hypothetical protein D0Y65_044706 [Glycine soja]KAG4942218.1 hypothetical protein JHK85_046864 [Glycine max]KAG5096567.1 hypothetical protein JHK82_046421 [Glycine max]KAG5101357.1 hypothetical protein JHK84_046326 [Glycine max]
MVRVATKVSWARKKMTITRTFTIMSISMKGSFNRFARMTIQDSEMAISKKRSLCRCHQGFDYCFYLSLKEIDFVFEMLGFCIKNGCFLRTH